MRVTIKTLAKALNLSTATVSKALNDSYEISNDTKQRVKALARELHYVPDLNASSLRSGRSKTIAVIIPEVADSFFSQAINGIESVAQEKGYHVLFYLTHESVAKEQAILQDFQSGRVDGVLISVTAETHNAAHIKALESKRIPVVFFDRICDEMETAKIITDDYESGYKACQHLINCGCRQIALLSISENLSISNQRMDGYKKALADNNLPFNPGNIIFCANDESYNFCLIKNLMDQANRPDGIIATVEKLSGSIYFVCRELHLHIPTQVKVIGFSNLQSAWLLNPPLTTITQPAFNMGKAAAVALFKAINKKNYSPKNEILVIPSTLEIRNSTVI